MFKASLCAHRPAQKAGVPGEAGFSRTFSPQRRLGCSLPPALPGNQEIQPNTGNEPGRFYGILNRELCCGTGGAAPPSSCLRATRASPAGGAAPPGEASPEGKVGAWRGLAAGLAADVTGAWAEHGSPAGPWFHTIWFPAVAFFCEQAGSPGGPPSALPSSLAAHAAHLASLLRPWQLGFQHILLSTGSKPRTVRHRLSQVLPSRALRTVCALSQGPWGPEHIEWQPETPTPQAWGLPRTAPSPPPAL